MQEFVSVDGLAADRDGNVDFVLGEGTRLFRERDRHDFELAETRSFESGTVLLSYRPQAGSTAR